MNGRTGPMRHDVAWLHVVRWGTVLVLWGVLAVVWLLPHLDLSLRAAAPFGLAAAICRSLLLGLERSRHPAPHGLATLALCADTALLTALLEITGGVFNPFIVIFGVYAWLALATLPGLWSAVVIAGAFAGGGWLVVDHMQAGAVEHHRLNDFPAHLFTMWFAGAAVAELVAHYVARARAALADRQRELEATRDRAARSEHLASLTTLAAGAAHELSTPLATIAVAARELERHAERLSASAASVIPLRDDARLIRAEVDRCQIILDTLSGRASGGEDSQTNPLTPNAVADLVRSRLSEDQRQRLRVEIAPGTAAPSAPGAAIVQGIAALLRNAFDASASGDVLLRFAQRDAMVRIEVQDRGPGMSADTLRRAGEPFYTTKPAGRGMGLGLFLTRALAERSGGALHFETANGTTAVLEVPAAIDKKVVA